MKTNRKHAGKSIMHSIIIIVLLAFQFGYLRAQEISTDIHGKKVCFFINFEKKLKSKPFISESQYISMDDSEQPVFFRRKENEIPDLQVQYSFGKNDSLMNEILYEWDVHNFEEGLNTPKSLAFNKAMANKYEQLLNLLTKKFGKSESKGTLDDFSKLSSRDGMKREDSWKPNDSTSIEMYVALSDFYEKSGFVTTPTVHRIRLYVRNIKNKKTFEPDGDAVKLADAEFQQFLSALKENDLEKARQHLSETAKAAVTDAQLKGLRGYLNMDKGMEIYFQGFDLATTGKTNLALQYKYVDDKKLPPDFLIKVRFNDLNKIIVVLPMNLSK